MKVVDRPHLLFLSINLIKIAYYGMIYLPSSNLETKMQDQKPIQAENEPIQVPKPHFDNVIRHPFVKRRMIFLISGLAICLIIFCNSKKFYGC